jgi:hypothetical protein
MQPKPASHQSALRLAAELAAETRLYQLPDRSIGCDYWVNSTEISGVRVIRIRLDSMVVNSKTFKFCHQVNPYIAEMWFSEMKTIVAKHGMTGNVKFYRYWGSCCVKVYYKSDGKYLSGYYADQDYDKRAQQFYEWFYPLREKFVNAQYEFNSGSVVI